MTCNARTVRGSVNGATMGSQKYILFDFDQDRLPVGSVQKDLSECLEEMFYGHLLLSDLFKIRDGNLRPQSWLPLPSDNYGYVETLSYRSENLCGILADHGLSGRFWITDEYLDEAPTGDADARERIDRNMVEFGPEVEDFYARRDLAQREYDIQSAAELLVFKMRAVQEWLDNVEPRDVVELYHKLGPNLCPLDRMDKDKFRKVCEELFSQEGLPLASKTLP